MGIWLQKMGPTMGRHQQSRMTQPERDTQLRCWARAGGWRGLMEGLSAWKRGRVLGSVGAPGRVMSCFTPVP